MRRHLRPHGSPAFIHYDVSPSLRPVSRTEIEQHKTAAWSDIERTQNVYSLNMKRWYT